MIPPKPPSRPGRVPLWRYLRLFRADILSAQPARLYRAWMAEFRTPFLHSFLVNDPALVKTVLKDRPGDFPKSARVAEGLRPLLGASVFLTNGAEWRRQRRIVDPAFEGGRLRESYPAMWAAGQAALARLGAEAGGLVEIEAQTSHAAADVIFRTLFSLPIEDRLAQSIFQEFRTYQRSQPILNLAALLPLARRLPHFRRRATRRSVGRLRALIGELTARRMAEIAAGKAPDDLATKIMTTRDPETGARLSAREMADQVAIFLLAGNETSASALGWALWLVAATPSWQTRLAEEARCLGEVPDFGDIARLKLSRDVFRETLRLYPPVPMMVREATCPERFRGRDVPKGAQIVLSPWHQHRHERLWENPDAFDPARWETENGRSCAREAYMPFSAGPRVCTGAGFAMVEGPLLLSLILRDFEVRTVPDKVPEPVAFLTVRSRDGIWLHVARRHRR